MASPQSAHTSQTWTSSSSTSTSTTSAWMNSTRMNDLPTQLSPPQTEAQEILRHLIAKLKDPRSRYYARYGKWVERHPRLDDFCFRCVRSQVWSFLHGRWSLDAYVRTLLSSCYTITCYDLQQHSAPSMDLCHTDRLDLPQIWRKIPSHEPTV